MNRVKFVLLLAGFMLALALALSCSKIEFDNPCDTGSTKPDPQACAERAGNVELSSSSMASSSSAESSSSGDAVSSSSSSVGESSSSSESSSSGDAVSSSSDAVSSSSGVALLPCGIYTFNPEIQFCQDDEKPLTLCGGSKPYESWQFCSGGEVYDKCNNATYSPTASICCNNATYPKNTYGCCNDVKQFLLASEFCYGSKVYEKCGGNDYNPDTHYCHTDGNTYSCNDKPYNPSTHFCYNDSKIGAKCGTRTEIFDPDLYECRSGSKIYLKTPVSYEGKSYDAVLIGSQTWMAKNLNYVVSGSKCGNGNGLSDANSTTCDNYGRLYNWATALKIDASCNNKTLASCGAVVSSKQQGVCPDKWHIPSDADWTALMTAVGGSSTAGTKLKTASGWTVATNGTPIGTDDYGFSALPGGGGNSAGQFGIIGNYGIWWSTNEYSTSNAYRGSMSYDYERVNYTSTDKSDFLSVRCVKD